MPTVVEVVPKVVEVVLNLPEVVNGVRWALWVLGGYVLLCMLLRILEAVEGELRC